MVEYEVMEDDLRDYREGDVVEVVIKNRDTLEHVPVRAVIHKHFDESLDAEKLWVRALETGVIKADPWRVKIIEELDYDEFAAKDGARPR